MHPKHMMMAVLVAMIWGSNFLFVHMSIQSVPPFTLCVIRFFLTSIPLIFIMKPPAVSWSWLSLYSLLTFALQFAFLFLGMQAGVSPGLASLLIQMQVFFSFFLASFFLGERLTRYQLIGTFIALIGIAFVLTHIGAKDITLRGFFWVLAAAFVRGAGNLCIKKMNCQQGMGLIIWSSALACPPLFLASYFLDGPTALMGALNLISWQGLLAIIFIAYASTWIGYGLWAWLISIYPVSQVVPFTLLVPVVGMLASALIFGEVLTYWKIMAALFISLGLLIHLFGERLNLFSLFSRRQMQQSL